MGGSQLLFMHWPLHARCRQKLIFGRLYLGTRRRIREGDDVGLGIAPQDREMACLRVHLKCDGLRFFRPANLAFCATGCYNFHCFDLLVGVCLDPPPPWSFLLVIAPWLHHPRVCRLYIIAPGRQLSPFWRPFLILTRPRRSRKSGY